MTKKASEQNPFAEFTKILETQREELDKIMKPFLESQQKAIMENILETSRKMIKMMSDSQKMSSASSSMDPGDQFKDYFRTMQKIQESWMDQLKSTSEMFQDMIKKNT